MAWVSGEVVSLGRNIDYDLGANSDDAEVRQ